MTALPIICVIGIGVAVLLIVAVVTGRISRQPMTDEHSDEHEDPNDAGHP